MAIDPEDLKLSDKHQAFLEELAQRTGKTPAEIMGDVLDAAANSVDQLRAALKEGIDALDAGKGEPLDIDAIKVELKEEFDSNGQPS